MSRQLFRKFGESFRKIVLENATNVDFKVFRIFSDTLLKSSKTALWVQIFDQLNSRYLAVSLG